ncbi:MAG: prepilin-type N-terminal cleavage/methylation domain-containing protein [Kiritimatiellae bacterium]|nr:prepilin-type N-terminal cleavage/methylation domain-containing protein [Kiritimatiellia bacterium]
MERGRPSRVRHRAFTLVELMFAMAIGGLIVVGVIGVFVVHLRAYRRQQHMLEMQENLRAAVDTVARDVRMAGYGLAVPNSHLTNWVTWVAGFAGNPCITPGVAADDPDTLCVAGAFDPPCAALSQAATNGATVLHLRPGEAGQFNTTDRNVLYVGRCETVRVVGQSGDTVTISRDPVLEGKGLRNAFAAGAPVELVKAVIYACRPAGNEFPRQPYLVRNDAAVSVAVEWQNMVAGHIEDFQVARGTNSLTIEITGRTRAPDPRYTDPVHGDGYRRMTLATEVTPRNPRLTGLP